MPVANKGLMLYDYNGNLVWQNDELLGRVVYLEDKDQVCVYWSHSYDGNVGEGILVIGKITIASMKDGQIVTSADIFDSTDAVIHNNKTVICSTGKMYDISSGSIKEIEQSFEFFVG